MSKKPPLGQVFLRDKNVLNKMVSLIENPERLEILEVGPGDGSLTEYLLQKGYKVKSIEIDEKFLEILERKFSLEIKEGHLEVILMDYLKFKTQNRYVLVSNIPYYITSVILEKIVFEHKFYPKVYLTVQWEVSQRLVASPKSKEFSSLTIFVQNFYDPRVLFKIKKNSFYPVPKVDSAFVCLTHRESPILPYEPNSNFFKFVKRCFLERRKTMKRILLNMGFEKNILEPLETIDFMRKRPEEIPIFEWGRIYSILEERLKTLYKLPNPWF